MTTDIAAMREDLKTARDWSEVGLVDVVEVLTILDELEAARAEIARLRDALWKLTNVVEDFHQFCSRADRPCGDYDAECPIAMGEWVDNSDRNAVKIAREILNSETNTSTAPEPAIVP